MLSKLIRPDDNRAGSAIEWRPGALPGAPVRAVQPWSPVTQAAPSALAADEIAAQTQAAYQKGSTEGAAAATQRAMQKLDPAIAGFNGVVQEFGGMRKKFRAEVEQDTVKLAIAIARRVLHRELATDPEAILGLVMAAFQKLNARETQRLRVSPMDAAAIQENRARMDLPSSLEVCADPALASGSAIFETSRGELDASVGTQLAEIERGFADLVRKR